MPPRLRVCHLRNDSLQCSIRPSSLGRIDHGALSLTRLRGSSAVHIVFVVGRKFEQAQLLCFFQRTHVSHSPGSCAPVVLFGLADSDQKGGTRNFVEELKVCHSEVVGDARERAVNGELEGALVEVKVFEIGVCDGRSVLSAQEEGKHGMTNDSRPPIHAVIRVESEDQERGWVKVFLSNFVHEVVPGRPSG